MNDAPVGENVSTESIISQVADEYVQRLERGENPDVEEYARRYPQLATVIRQLLPALLVMRVSGGPHLVEDAQAGQVHLTGCLGDYRIQREVGRGGMGVVYEAVQISLDRRVALKVLPFAATLDPKHLHCFQNEAHAAAHLHYQHIVPVYGVGVERGVHYYAMQFSDGHTVAVLIHELREQPGAKPRSDVDASGPYQPRRLCQGLLL